MPTVQEILNSYGQVVQLAPEACAAQQLGFIADSRNLAFNQCENISFLVSNQGDARYLIFGPRGLTGNDTFYPGDMFQGANFADSAPFLVDGVPNGGPFQSFNYKCGQTSYKLDSVTFRRVPIASAVSSAFGFFESYGCDPANRCNAKKLQALCSPCGNQNSDYTDVRYNLMDAPIDYLHAFGLLIPAGTAEVPTVVNVEVAIKAIATAHIYVPCGSTAAPFVA